MNSFIWSLLLKYTFGHDDDGDDGDDDDDDTIFISVTYIFRKKISSNVQYLGRTNN